MVFSPSEHEVSHGSKFLDNPNTSTSDSNSDGSGFGFSDVFSRVKTQNEGSVGLPPLSSDSNSETLDSHSSLAPPLALDNHQSIDEYYPALNHATQETKRQNESFNNFQSNIAARPNQTSLALESAIDPHNENSATTLVAFGEAIHSKIEGVARAIKEAQLKTPQIELVDEPAPKSNKLSWIENKSPIESLFNLRSNEKTVPVPTELFSTSQKSIDEPDTKSKASIGLENIDNLPNYKDHQYGRLREFARTNETLEQIEGTDRFERLSGSPEDFLNRHKIDQANRFRGSDTRHTKTIIGERAGSSVTARDFSSLETSFGPDGEITTNEFDSYRRPLSKLEETYSKDGKHSFELSQFSYGEGSKVKPFADYTRIVKYSDNKALVQVFNNQGIKPELISENSWS